MRAPGRPFKEVYEFDSEAERAHLRRLAAWLHKQNGAPATDAPVDGVDAWGRYLKQSSGGIRT